MLNECGNWTSEAQKEGVAGNPDENGDRQGGMIGKDFKSFFFSFFFPFKPAIVGDVRRSRDMLSVAGCKRVIPPLR